MRQSTRKICQNKCEKKLQKTSSSTRKGKQKTSLPALQTHFRKNPPSHGKTAEKGSGTGRREHFRGGRVTSTGLEENGSRKHLLKERTTSWGWNTRSQGVNVRKKGSCRALQGAGGGHPRCIPMVSKTWKRQNRCWHRKKGRDAHFNYEPFPRKIDSPSWAREEEGKQKAIM